MERPFILNFKNYSEISAEKTVLLARTAQEAARNSNADIVLAPPQPSLALITQTVTLPVICQHIDDVKLGQTTGFFVAEIARSYGARGSIVNHSEHKIDLKSIDNLIRELRRLEMTSIVCAQTPHEVSEIARFSPDFIAIEPPELIGSGKAVSKENPTIITDSIKASKQYSNSTKVICGAGITDKSDVAAALDLGAEGILVASGVIKAQSWYEKILGLVSPLLK